MLRSAGESVVSAGALGPCANPATGPRTKSRRAAIRLMTFLSLVFEFQEKIRGRYCSATATRQDYFTGQMPLGWPLQPFCPGPMWWLSRPLWAGFTYGKVAP